MFVSRSVHCCSIFFICFPVVLSGRASGFDSVLPSGPDIAQFKQGVKTVAGKMAVLANGVMNTIQVRHQSPESKVFWTQTHVFHILSSGPLRLLLIGDSALAVIGGRMYKPKPTNQPGGEDGGDCMRISCSSPSKDIFNQSETVFARSHQDSWVLSS